MPTVTASIPRFGQSVNLETVCCESAHNRTSSFVSTKPKMFDFSVTVHGRTQKGRRRSVSNRIWVGHHAAYALLLLSTSCFFEECHLSKAMSVQIGNMAVLLFFQCLDTSLRNGLGSRKNTLTTRWLSLSAACRMILVWP